MKKLIESVIAESHAKTERRKNLNAADFLTLDGEEMQALAAAAVEKAMQRRERDNGQDVAVMRRKYQEDARQEMIARAYDMIFGAWIHGTMEDGTPRAYMPLALFAAIAAGKALDSIIYQDGGHNVKLSAKEAREHYPERAESPARPVDVFALSDMADAVQRGDVTPEEYTAAARAFYGKGGNAYTVTTRVSDPISPAPEAAVISAETLPRILEYISGDKTREHAANLLTLMYTGYTIPEAAAEMGIKERRAEYVFTAICNAAALMKVEDGESADLERLIAAERETEKNNITYRRAYKAAAAALAKVSSGEAVSPAVKWGKHIPAAVEALRRMSYIERCTAGQKALADAFNAE